MKRVLHKENIDFFILTHPQSKLTLPGHFVRSLLYSSNPRAHQSNMRWARSLHAHDAHHHDAHCYAIYIPQPMPRFVTTRFALPWRASNDSLSVR